MFMTRAPAHRIAEIPQSPRISAGVKFFKDFKEQGPITFKDFKDSPISDRIAAPRAQTLAHPVRQIDKFLAVADV